MRSFTQVLRGHLLRSFMEVDILGKDSNNKTCKKFM